MIFGCVSKDPKILQFLNGHFRQIMGIVGTQFQDEALTPAIHQGFKPTFPCKHHAFPSFVPHRQASTSRPHIHWIQNQHNLWDGRMENVNPGNDRFAKYRLHSCRMPGSVKLTIPVMPTISVQWSVKRVWVQKCSSHLHPKKTTKLGPRKVRIREIDETVAAVPQIQRLRYATTVPLQRLRHCCSRPWTHWFQDQSASTGSQRFPKSQTSKTGEDPLWGPLGVGTYLATTNLLPEGIENVPFHGKAVNPTCWALQEASVGCTCQAMLTDEYLQIDSYIHEIRVLI